MLHMVFMFFFAKDTHLNTLRSLNAIPCSVSYFMMLVVSYISFWSLKSFGLQGACSHFFEVACLRNIPKLDIGRSSFSATYNLPISLDRPYVCFSRNLITQFLVLFFHEINNCYIVRLEYAFLICVGLRPIFLNATSDQYLPFAFYVAFVSRGEWC